jgi:hypothetical protein
MGLSPEARQYFYQSMLPAIEGKVSQNVHKKSYDDIVLEAYEREPVGISQFIRDPYYLGTILRDSIL